MRDSLQNLNEIGKCLSWNEDGQGYILTMDEKKIVTYIHNDTKDIRRLPCLF